MAFKQRTCIKQEFLPPHLETNNLNLFYKGNFELFYQMKNLILIGLMVAAVTENGHQNRLKYIEKVLFQSKIKNLHRAQAKTLKLNKST